MGRPLFLIAAAAAASSSATAAPPGARADGATLLSAPPAFYPRAASCVNADGRPLALAVVEAPTGAERRLALLRRVAERNATAPEAWAATGAAIASAPARADVDLANGFLLQLANGALLCAYRHHDGNGTARTFRIAVSRSLDYGATWAPLAIIAEGPVGLWEPYLVTFPSDDAGTVRVFYSAELTNGGEQDVVAQTSRDGGATWGAVDVRLHTPGSRNGMPGVVELADGSLFLVFEGFWSAAGWGHFTVNSLRSFDGGLTWVQPLVIHEPSSPAWNSGSPQVAICPQTAKIVVVFMSNEPLPPSSAGSPRERGGLSWPDGAHLGLVSARLNASNVSAPLSFPSSAGVIPTDTTIFWPSLLLDVLGDGPFVFSLRAAYQGASGSAFLSENTLCID